MSTYTVFWGEHSWEGGGMEQETIWETTATRGVMTMPGWWQQMWWKTTRVSMHLERLLTGIANEQVRVACERTDKDDSKDLDLN